MIKDALVSGTYSLALFRECIERKSLEQVKEDLKNLALILEKNVKLRRFLEGPQFLTEDKLSLIERVLGNRIHELSLSFLKLIILKNRIEYFSDIRGHFNERIMKYEGFVEVCVTSALVLNENEVEKLKTKLAEITDGKIQLKQRVNPNILGGLLIKFGHILIDNTLRCRLNEIRIVLNDVKVH